MSVLIKRGHVRLINSLKYALFFFINTIASSSEANIQKQMTHLLGTMSNSSRPGIYETQRRGVISGGSVVVRHKIMDESILSFVPPSANAGCGGIDLYAGSLSFINADQFIQLLRAIASNAKGYAFQLALSAMCEKCSQHIETLQKKVQQINTYLGNSCQLAQGIVNDSLGAFEAKGQSEASLLGMIHGVGDLFSSHVPQKGQSPYGNLQEIAPDVFKETVQGNLVWRALKKNAIDGWFLSGDDELLENIMSVTGSLIITPKGMLGSDEAPEYKVDYLPGQLITLEILLLGAEVQRYHCDDHHINGCLHPILKKEELKGLAQRVSELLLGDGISEGIITQYANNQGRFKDSEKAFLSIVPAHIGTMIRTLSALNEEVARGFAQRAAPFIALEMARVMIDSMIKSVSQTLPIDTHHYAPLLQKMMSQLREEINQHYHALILRFGSEQDIIFHYNQLLQLIQRPSYLELSMVLGAIDVGN